MGNITRDRGMGRRRRPGQTHLATHQNGVLLDIKQRCYRLHHFNALYQLQNLPSLSEGERGHAHGAQGSQVVR